MFYTFTTHKNADEDCKERENEQKKNVVLSHFDRRVVLNFISLVKTQSGKQDWKDVNVCKLM